MIFTVHRLVIDKLRREVLCLIEIIISTKHINHIIFWRLNTWMGDRLGAVGTFFSLIQ